MPKTIFVVVKGIKVQAQTMKKMPHLKRAGMRRDQKVRVRPNNHRLRWRREGWVREMIEGEGGKEGGSDERRGWEKVKKREMVGGREGGKRG